MRVLALDVDGVLLDPDRAGDGHWSNELARRHGIERAQLREHFFKPRWPDVLVGRLAVAPALDEALRAIGTDVTVEQVLSCWFEADFVPVEPALDLARRAKAAGVQIVLATNQEHRRATYLRERFRSLIDVDDMVYAADLGHVKHEPAFFELASKRLGLTADQRADVVFVDDSAANVDVARSCGWRALHATPDLGWIGSVAAMIVD